MENTNQYLLSNDEKIINTFIKGLQEINITTFEQLCVECKARNITTFTDFFEYTRSHEAPEMLSLGAELLLNRVKAIKREKMESFCSSSQIGYYLSNVLSGCYQEHLMAVYVDVKNKIIAEKVIFKGTLNQAIIHPRDIFRWAIIYNAAGFFLAHNHPSEDLTPSEQDIQVTKKISSVSECMGIRFLDHFIVNTGNYLSFKEMELL